MEAVPGTAQSDTSCRNPPEHSEMPGEGLGLRGTWGRAGVGVGWGGKSGKMPLFLLSQKVGKS